MSVIDRITAHFDALGMQSIEVPEWGEPGKPLVIWFKPITVHAVSQITKDHLPQEKRPTSAKIAADMLIARALGSDGKPLFTVDDRERLLHHADATVVNRVALQLAGARSVEDMEKN